MTRNTTNALFVLHFIVLFLGISLNGALLFAFFKSWRVRRLPANKLVFSLILSDFLIEAGFMVNEALRDASEPAKKIAYSLKINAMTLTVLNLCMIWIDRVIAVKMSFRYFKLMSNKTVKNMLGVAWGAGASFCFLAVGIFFIERKTAYMKSRLVISAIAIIGFVVLGIANVIIFREVRTQINKVKCQQVKNCRSILMLHFRSAYMCTLMVTAFLIFWLPYIIENVSLLFDSPLDVPWFTLFADLMISCNTLAHPFLYVLLNKDLRDLLRRRWRVWKIMKFPN